MRETKLSSSDREFLTMVAQAAFANPFSDERTEIDRRIANLPGDVPENQLLPATITRVRSFLDSRGDPARLHLQHVSIDDRGPLMVAHLFDIFHLFSGKFDDLIRQQIREVEEPVDVPFADEVLRSLKGRGFSQQEASQYFAIFYQLRRAYYFIDVALCGRSPSMKRLRRTLWNNVFTSDIRLYEQLLWNRMEDFSTLLLGETGTGKGTAASAIGRSGFIPFDERKRAFSESFMRSFLAINLSQYPEGLIESELFGHRKGAFTGAVEAHEGVFQRCSPHGAIFLDEIGDVSTPVQIKLLQVLQERVFLPVGSHKRQRFNGRVIAATNRSMAELREKQLLRDDFYYRLCSDIITVPTLRQRLAESPGELDELLAVTVERIVGSPSQELVGRVRQIIERDLGTDYAWPGNVRELEQCVRRTLLTNEYQGNHPSAVNDLQGEIAHRIDQGDYQARDLLCDYCRLLYRRHGTYEEVARRTDLDRRTVKKYVTGHARE